MLQTNLPPPLNVGFVIFARKQIFEPRAKRPFQSLDLFESTGDDLHGRRSLLDGEVKVVDQRSEMHLGGRRQLAHSLRIIVRPIDVPLQFAIALEQPAGLHEGSYEKYEKTPLGRGFGQTGQVIFRKQPLASLPPATIVAQDCEE